MTTPSPTTWTLRCKAHKTTVLLHINPLQTFNSIKQQLYNALRDTTIKHADTGEPLPPPVSPSDIQFGRPSNINDPHGGFILGEWESATGFNDSEDVDMTNGKGKGKATVKKGAENTKECPKGAGLRDGAVLAFRWRGDGTVWLDEEDEDEGLGGEDTGRREPSMWGIKLASFEDAYGVENEGDVGGGREFEG